MSQDPVAIVKTFARAISTQDVHALAGLMTPDHVFVDSDGSETRGRDQMRAGWAQYFRMFPDYRIDVQETYSRGRVVVLVGTAEGTYAVAGELRTENHWCVPAVWRAVVREGAIQEWRVYVNVEPIAQIMAKHQT